MLIQHILSLSDTPGIVLLHLQRNALRTKSHKETVRRPDEVGSREGRNFCHCRNCAKNSSWAHLAPSLTGTMRFMPRSNNGSSLKVTIYRHVLSRHWTPGASYPLFQSLGVELWHRICSTCLLTIERELSVIISVQVCCKKGKFGLLRKTIDGD